MCVRLFFNFAGVKYLIQMTDISGFCNHIAKRLYHQMRINKCLNVAFVNFQTNESELIIICPSPTMIYKGF